MLINDLASDHTCSSNIFDDAIISFYQIGFLPISFIVLCGWFILNKFYNFIVKVLLCQLSIKDYEIKRLLTVHWNISFTTITIPFALEALSIPLDEFFQEFYWNLERNITIWFTQEPVTIKTKIIYILLTGFFLNKVCQISIEKGLKNIDFVISEFFAVFFVSSFAYRCIRFGIAFMILYNAAQSLLELTRMLYCFSEIYPSKMANICTRFVLLTYIVVWLIIFFHVIPNHFLIMTMKAVIRSLDDASHVLILMLLNAALWGFYILHVTSSPFSKLIWSLVIQETTSIEHILFDTSTAGAADVQEQHATNCLQHSPHAAVTASLKNQLNVDLAKGHKSKENLSKIYQTVKCYIRIKRKLDRIRIKLKEEKAKKKMEEETIREVDKETSE